TKEDVEKGGVILEDETKEEEKKNGAALKKVACHATDGRGREDTRPNHETHLSPQEVHGQPDLEEAVPHRVQVRHEVLYPLRVDAHQVRDLARPAVRVALPEGEHEGLAVYRDDDGGPHPEPDRVALAGRTGEAGRKEVEIPTREKCPPRPSEEDGRLA
ncbi:hypothetical protein THAOC_06146, partial [Thalassiosira oceanica]